MIGKTKILRKLAAGCKDHPAYRYKRVPKTCAACIELFSDRKRLDELDARTAENMARASSIWFGPAKRTRENKHSN